ncbi:MAG: helix-turn-helix domain-containing protein [Chitinispirillia bacterium]|nr:helix-turn-helix domain-containing protein [Chitinispirillia bacterium]MCL2241668.1 helix-turn-helix domain-containing protein [Chitinispirillia bacterium]
MNNFNIKLTFSPALPASVFIVILLSAFVLLLAPAGAVAQPNCISFESPLAGSVHSAPRCTVSLNVECVGVTQVDLYVRVFVGGSDSAVIRPMNVSFSRPPYKVLWTTNDLPNQLFTGAAIMAEATISGAPAQIARQEGIFLTHNKPARKFISIPYMPASANNIDGEHSQKFNLGDPQKSAVASIVWSEKDLTFNVTVKDPSIQQNQAGRNMAEAGLEILIDPSRNKSPHPADSVLFFVVPLSGTPYSIDYHAEIADGAFKLIPNSARANYPHSVGISNFKGYSVRFSVPRETFGKVFPDTIGVNMVLRTFGDHGQIHKISLSGNNIYEMYSPFIWNDYHRLPKPFFMNIALQWVIFSVAGFLLAMLAYAIIARMRKPQLLSNFERSEEEKQAFERVNAVIEQQLVKKDLTAEAVAGACGMDALTLTGVIKRNTGFTFINYLQFCRTEVAKERLRSSRSSEKSIADLCGFANAMEMEKCFQKFHHTTPYKFRTQQQVS